MTPLVPEIAAAPRRKPCGRFENHRIAIRGKARGALSQLLLTVSLVVTDASTRRRRRFVQAEPRIMNAVFYSLAFRGSQIAHVQLIRSIQSIRHFDRDVPVFVFLLGDPPQGFVEALGRLDAKVKRLGGYLEYISRQEPDRAELIALDPKLHRWLVLEEPELKACTRLLYVDSDTFFFASPARLFDRYRIFDLYAREEPFCRRSILGYDPSYVDEEQIAKLREREGVAPVPPFNTGVCIFTREMADAISLVLPRYFDNLFRFFSWFYLNPLPERAGDSSTGAVYDPRFRPSADLALPYPSNNRWIVDQVAMWLALGKFSDFSYGDLKPSDVWQGAEYHKMFAIAPLPILCHYYGSNTNSFFSHLQRLSGQTKTR